MSNHTTDAKIVAGLRKGEREAWDALCHQYGERLSRYVSWLIGSDVESVSDIFQETLFAVAKSGRTIRPDTHVWAWLSRIAHNQVALYWRKHYRDRGTRLTQEAIAERLAEETSDALIRQETVEAIRDLLTTMKSEHVALLMAKYIDEMTIAEMAQQLGGTEASIRNKLARARDDFRARYANHNQAPIVHRKGES